MSASIEQKRVYARNLVQDPAADDFRQDILLKLFNDWLETDDLEEWERIRAKREGLSEFMQMAAAVDAMSRDLNKPEEA
jgi:hypothetical protein